MSKSYSCRSVCQCAVLRLRFLGDFQYWRFVWSVMMVNGSLVHPRYGRQCESAFITASSSLS